MENPSGRVVCRPLAAADGAGFEALVRLYEDALPASERKSRAQLEEMLASPRYVFLVARRGGAQLGFSVAYCGAALVLLEYMAVAPEARGQGIGAQLYRHTRRRAGGRPLIVEADSEAEPSSDRDTRARRKAFYRRMGCRQLDALAYLLPLDGGGAPPAMDLLVDGPDAEAVPRSTVSAWLREIYVEVYGQGPGDPRLETMTSRLPERVRLT